MTSKDPLKPVPTVLIKLGSIAVHVDELLSTQGHPFDVEVLKALMKDAELNEWLKQMDALALLPKKREVTDAPLRRKK